MNSSLLRLSTTVTSNINQKIEKPNQLSLLRSNSNISDLNNITTFEKICTLQRL